LPCIHVIKHGVNAQISLKLEHFHKHWHLYLPQNMPPADPQTIVLEPRVVQNGHGRLAGLVNNPRPPPSTNQITGTAKEPSEFERVTARENPARQRGRPPATPQEDSPLPPPSSPPVAFEDNPAVLHDSKENSNQVLLPNMAPPAPPPPDSTPVPARKRGRQPSSSNVHSSSPDPLAAPVSQRSRYGRKIRRADHDNEDYEYH
jgi:hypothetical protein